MISVSGMLAFKALSQMKEQDQSLMGPCARILSLIQQLVQLYHELQTASDGFTDLELLEEAKKRRPFLAIFGSGSLVMGSSTGMNPSPRCDLFFLNQVVKKGSWKEY